MKHNISITEYTRDDGVVLLKNVRGSWWLRCIHGPAYFWNPTEQQWECCLIDQNNMARFNLTQDHGLQLLGTVKKYEGR